MNSRKKRMLRRILFARQNGIVLVWDGYPIAAAACQYCGFYVAMDHITIDHVIPVLHNGKGTLSNTVLACRECNIRKGGALPCADCGKYKYLKHFDSITMVLTVTSVCGKVVTERQYRRTTKEERWKIKAQRAAKSLTARASSINSGRRSPGTVVTRDAGRWVPVSRSRDATSSLILAPAPAASMLQRN